MFSFCSIKVKPGPSPVTGFFSVARQELRCRPVDVGEKDLPEGVRFGEAAWQAQRSGDDVRRDLIFDEGDPVAQLQFAFFQPLQPQEVRRRRLMQRIDRRIEIAMLLLQAGELVLKLALIIVGHGVR